MNKARRHEMKMLKFKRRMKIWGFKRTLWLNPTSRANLYAFRSHGAPCSCYACSQPESKYNRAKEKSKIPILIDFELNYNMGEMVWDEDKGFYVYDQPEYWKLSG